MAPHDTLSAVTRGLPNTKAHGADGITAEIVKLGGEVHWRGIPLLYRAMSRSRCVPEK